MASNSDTSLPNADATGADPGASTDTSTREPAGLTDERVEQLRQRWGYNEIGDEAQSPLLGFLTYFWGPIPWMIEAAAVLSALIQHWAEFGVVAALLVANAVVGFWEEHQAGNAVAALRNKLAPYARAHRNDRWARIPARELVPGDLVRLRLGDVVPADVRLLARQSPLRVDQSSLTGESLPVEIGPEGEAYSGSVVKQGEADALVTATGEHTYFGETARLVSATQKRSHFQHAVMRIGRFLILVAVGLVALMVAVSLARGESTPTVLQYALVLTVAGIPVAMPTVMSVTMAVGARLLARRGAVVSRLAAVEELAGMDVLFTDKTGTLTNNRLQVGQVRVLNGFTREHTLRAAALCSRSEDDDPIDLAVLEAAGKVPPDEDVSTVVHFTPFDPVRKRTEAEVRGPNATTYRVAKGAPQVILELAAADHRAARRVVDAVESFAARGYRSLAVARTGEGGHWHLLGVLALYDAPRADAAQTVGAAHRLGIDVRMVTGDHAAIARQTARQLGLGTHIVEASRLPEHQDEVDERAASEIEAADGFAEVYPEHKHLIVAAVQRRGHITGMTGDGVNDAPALKRADTGIAVQGATDAARGAADIVLLTPGLAVIIDAVRESRKIFRRMKSYATYRIAETLRVLLFMVASILAFHFYPVTAVMIVLLALLNDGAILAIAYDRVRPSPRPEAWDMREVLGLAAVLGAFGVVESFGLFWAGKQWLHLDETTLQTLIYLKLSLAGHLTVFVTRTTGPFWSTRPAPVLLAAVAGTQLVATLIAVYGVMMAPLGWKLAGIVWAYALLGFLAEDAAKLATRRLFLRPRHETSAEGFASTHMREPIAHHP